VLYAEGETIAFQRELPGKCLIIVARRAQDSLNALSLDGTRLSEGYLFQELLTGATANLTDDKLSLDGLGSCGFQIWQAQGYTF